MPTQAMMDNKLQEIMLKNVWEIENNPMFTYNKNASRENISERELEEDKQQIHTGMVIHR